MAQPTPLEQQQQLLAALDMLHKGKTVEEVTAELQKRGVAEDEARAVVEQVQSKVPSKAKSGNPHLKNLRTRNTDYGVVFVSDKRDDDWKPQRQSIPREVIIGACICGMGVLFTLISYSSAATNGGGRYTIAIGAIIGGALMMFRGASRSQ